MAHLTEAHISPGPVCATTIKRKDELCEETRRLLQDSQVQSPDWLASPHWLVDELDELEPPSAPYDRLRLGDPVSRDTLRRCPPTLPRERLVGDLSAVWRY